MSPLSVAIKTRNYFEGIDRLKEGRKVIGSEPQWRDKSCPRFSPFAALHSGR